MGVYAVFIGALLIFCIIGIPLLSIGHAGGEQVPLTLLGHTLSVAVFGLIILSILSPIFFWRWYKKFRFIPLVVPVGVVVLLVWMVITIYLQNNHHFAF